MTHFKADDFPILAQRNDQGHRLVYLDNAATTQKPQSVLDAMDRYYRENNANVHRGAHWLANDATAAYEQARQKVCTFINAPSDKQIIWTRGTTEAINLVANSWGRQNLKSGDLIVLTVSEHHANIVPWQLICEQTGAHIEVVGLDNDNRLDMARFERLMGKRPKLVAMGHVSNALGTINPIKGMLTMAKSAGAVTLVDGAQAISHFEVDVSALDCDFYAFSGHKLFGPTGIGVLYGKLSLLEAMPPWQGGGEMIDKVSFEKTTFNTLPHKFEAGTPNIAGVIGLGAAIDFITIHNRTQWIAHEQGLFTQLYDWLSSEPSITVHSPQPHNVGVLSFNLEGEHHQDIGTLLDQQGIAARTGHHCAMPLMTALGVKGTVRISLSIYNTEQDVAAFIEAMDKILQMLELK